MLSLWLNRFTYWMLCFVDYTRFFFSVERTAWSESRVYLALALVQPLSTTPPPPLPTTPSTCLSKNLIWFLFLLELCIISFFWFSVSRLRCQRSRRLRVKLKSAACKWTEHHLLSASDGDRFMASTCWSPPPQPPFISVFFIVVHFCTTFFGNANQCKNLLCQNVCVCFPFLDFRGTSTKFQSAQRD